MAQVKAEKVKSLQKRLLAGRRKIEDLSQIINSLPPSEARQSLIEKQINMEIKWGELAAELLLWAGPSACLYGFKEKCREELKGAYECMECYRQLQEEGNRWGS